MSEEEYRQKFYDKNGVYPERIIWILARIYNHDSDISPSLAVAYVCDDVLDKSGRLLGEVRDKAYVLRKEEK